MKKIILLLGIMAAFSVASCTNEENAASNQSDIQTNGKVYKTMEEPVVGSTIEVMEEEQHFDSIIEPQVGATYDAIGDDINDTVTYGKPVKLVVICKRRSIGREPGDYVGVGVDSSGNYWSMTWDYSLNPDMTYTLKLTGHKIGPGGDYPCGGF